ncbi:hypothetical protein CTAYLR_009814 [Chrysophaeum taylorii]|uniref:General transcription factor IIH subunit 3 n=1 Tax=Chrysophaeum taylorii TaxID=2483200 RepID=A0AAD7U831_9STRA|nr:hypothetical protein CTAYLR_009814 [Chrysophaeum taylorii]
MERVELLGIIIEASPTIAISAFAVEFRKAVEGMLVLCNAHLLCHRHGELVCLAALPERTMYLHASHHSPGVRFADARVRIVETLHKAVVDMDALDPAPVATTAALGRFLCHAHKRAEALGERLSSRVLVLKLGDDIPSQYNTMMNCIFAAQRHGITIDSCVLSPQTSILMKQATQLTRGVYLHVAQRTGFEDLPVYLLSAFAASPSCRKHLRLPLVDEIDFRAACFCHKPPRILDRGWVCAICLSVYCDDHTKCACFEGPPAS